MMTTTYFIYSFQRETSPRLLLLCYFCLTLRWCCVMFYVWFVYLFVVYMYAYIKYMGNFSKLNWKTNIEGIAKKETNNTTKIHSAKQPSVPNRSQMNTKLAKCFWYCINAVCNVAYKHTPLPVNQTPHSCTLFALYIWM